MRGSVRVGERREERGRAGVRRCQPQAGSGMRAPALKSTTHHQSSAETPTLVCLPRALSLMATSVPSAAITVVLRPLLRCRGAAGAASPAGSIAALLRLLRRARCLGPASVLAAAESAAGAGSASMTALLRLVRRPRLASGAAAAAAAATAAAAGASSIVADTRRDVRRLRGAGCSPSACCAGAGAAAGASAAAAAASASGSEEAVAVREERRARRGLPSAGAASEVSGVAGPRAVACAWRGVARRPSQSGRAAGRCAWLLLRELARAFVGLPLKRAARHAATSRPARSAAAFHLFRAAASPSRPPTAPVRPHLLHHVAQQAVHRLPLGLGRALRGRVDVDLAGDGFGAHARSDERRTALAARAGAARSVRRLSR